jgi:hypothetical protein
MGKRAEREPAQPSSGEGTAEGNSYKDHQRVQDGVVRISDRPGCIPPPFELQALALKERYESKRRTQQEGPKDTPRHVDLGEIQLNTWRCWHAWLEEETRTRPHRAVCAVLPNWEEWRNKNGIPLIFRMIQILTGHGVFGEFLQRIGKEITSVCHHYGTRDDTAQHTLVACPAWEEPRRVLRMEVGEDLAPEALIRAVFGGRQGYSAVRTFCEQVMLAKERAERERMRTGHPARTDREERRTRRERPRAAVHNQE